MAATRNRKSLETWLRETINETVEEQPCSQVSLVHMVGNQPKELHSVKFGGGKSHDLKDLANMLRNRAEAYSQDLPGVQTFQLLGFYGKAEPQAFQPFTIQPMAEMNGLTTESPTETGRLQQSMRTQDALIAQVYRRQSVMDEHAMSIMSMQSRMLMEALGENRAMFSAFKEILVEQATRSHEHKMKEAAFVRASDERRKFLEYAPVLINTILGKEVFPQSKHDTVLMETIVENISDEQVQLLATIVKPELAGPLMERFTQIRAKKTKEEENRQKALEASDKANPLLEAGGEPTE